MQCLAFSNPRWWKFYDWKFSISSLLFSQHPNNCIKRKSIAELGKTDWNGTFNTEIDRLRMIECFCVTRSWMLLCSDRCTLKLELRDRLKRSVWRLNDSLHLCKQKLGLGQFTRTRWVEHGAGTIFELLDCKWAWCLIYVMTKLNLALLH